MWIRYTQVILNSVLKRELELRRLEPTGIETFELLYIILYELRHNAMNIVSEHQTTACGLDSPAQQEAILGTRISGAVGGICIVDANKQTNKRIDMYKSSVLVRTIIRRHTQSRGSLNSKMSTLKTLNFIDVIILINIYIQFQTSLKLYLERFLHVFFSEK